MSPNTVSQSTIDTAVVRVGEGRGFVVETSDPLHGRLIITAAHCLPHLPISFGEAVTYKALLGPLTTEPTVWAELVFADLVADIAVLAAPDEQTHSHQSDAYDELVSKASVLEVEVESITGGRADGLLAPVA